MGNRTLATALAITLATALPALAGPEDPSHEIKAAQRVLLAVPADRERVLRVIAADELLDVWIVWERLAVSGETKLRDLYRDLVANKAIALHASKRKITDADRTLWRRWDLGRKVRLANFTAAARELLLKLESGKTVTGVLRHLEIARCFRDEKRMDDAIKHWVAGARLARSIGWSSAYRYALNVFVFDLEKPHRPFGARQRLLGDANWLRPGQANVHCFRSGPNVFAIVLQKGRVRAEWIGEFDSISERISELARLGRHAAGSSRWLVSKFEAPLKLGKDNRRVHIVVDREFVMVPFEAIYSTASVTRGRRYSGRAAPMHAGDAKGALLLDWRKDGWSHAESTRKLFDRIEDLNWPDVRLLEAAMAARPRWKVVVCSTIRRTVAELIGSTPDRDDAESEVREWPQLARRFGRPRSKRSDIKMHVLVLPSGPVALPLDDGEPFKTASMTIAVRSAQTVLCLAYEIPEKSKAAFLEKFLQELNGTVSGKPVNAAIAASRARRRCAVREDLPAEHAWAWQLWTE